MATAQNLINRAAKLSGVKAAGQTLDGEANNDALALLNDLLESLRNEGIDLGQSTLTVSSTLYVDDADLLALRYLLADEIAIDNERQLPPRVLQKAEMHRRTLQAKYASIPEADLPQELRSDYYFDINTG